MAIAVSCFVVANLKSVLFYTKAMTLFLHTQTYTKQLEEAVEIASLEQTNGKLVFSRLRHKYYFLITVGCCEQLIYTYGKS